MNRYVLRKENFGGLLFDRAALEIKPVLNGGFEALASLPDTDVICRPNPRPTTLSAPTRVFIAITSQCNLHCKHCSNSSGRERSEWLSYEEIESLVAQFAQMGVFEIGIYGGEPLCHPAFFDIIRLVKERGFPVLINTNGVYEECDLQRLAAAGIDKIKVSIDGLEETNDAIRGRGTFQRAVASLRLLRQAGNDVRINFTLTHQNRRHILAMVALADELGCGIKIAPLVKVGRAKSLPEAELSQQEGLEVYRQVERYCREQHIQAPVEMDSHLVARACSDVLAKFHYRYTRCGIRRTHASIDSDGSVYSTGRQTAFDDEGCMGNIRQEPFARLWDQINQKTAAVEPVCEGCRRVGAEALLIESFRVSDHPGRSLFDEPN